MNYEIFKQVHYYSYFICLAIVLSLILSEYCKDKKSDKIEKAFYFIITCVVSYIFLYVSYENQSHIRSIAFLLLYSITFYIIDSATFYINNPFDVKENMDFIKNKDADLKLIPTFSRISLVNAEDKYNFLFDSSDPIEILKAFDNMENFIINDTFIFENKWFLLKDIRIDIIECFVNYRFGKTKAFRGREIPYNIQIYLYAIEIDKPSFFKDKN